MYFTKTLQTVIAPFYYYFQHYPSSDFYCNLNNFLCYSPQWQFIIYFKVLQVIWCYELQFKICNTNAFSVSTPTKITKLYFLIPSNEFSGGYSAGNLMRPINSSFSVVKFIFFGSSYYYSQLEPIVSHRFSFYLISSLTISFQLARSTTQDDFFSNNL